MTEWYPGYISEPTLTDKEVMSEIDRGCGHVEGEVRTLDPRMASPAPEPTGEGSSKFIRGVPKKIARGQKLPGHAGGCGRNSKARNKAGE